jgi:chromate transporter
VPVGAGRDPWLAASVMTGAGVASETGRAGGESSAPAHPSFGEAFRLWLKLGFINFGGPAGQIAIMHRMLVEERRWIGEQRFLHALNYCTFLPGPEAQQLATYVGWLLHRTWGGIVAGTLFVLPGYFCLLALSAIYAGYGAVPAVDAVFYGLQAAILAIVFEALIRVGKRALANGVMVAIAAFAFIALFLLQLPFPLVVIAAALIGYVGGELRPDLFKMGGHGGKSATAVDRVLDGEAEHTKPSLRRLVGVSAVWLAIWFLPVVVAAVILGLSHTYVQLMLFFSKMAVVTFGGAYAVLAYVAQEAVNHYGWLSTGDMLKGLALAETTPGPLILVLEFVGFLAGYRDPGGLPPMLSGWIAASLTVWVTFVPSFLWIFAGAPYIEQLRNNRRLAAAMTAITAAVVGVILNLALWFALNVIFPRLAFAEAYGIRFPSPDWSSFDPAAAAIALASAVILFWLRLGMIPTLGASALFGLAWRLAFA